MTKGRKTTQEERAEIHSLLHRAWKELWIDSRNIQGILSTSMHG